MSQEIVVDVVADLVCPWCYIGERRLATAAAQTGVTLRWRHHPFLLEPNAPAEGMDLRQRLAQKYGTAPENMFGRVEAEGRSAGLPLDFSKIQIMPATTPGHTLVRLAPDACRDALVDALFEAYFVRGENIGQTEVLIAVGARVGLSEEAVRAAVQNPAALAETQALARQSASQGVRSVPFFVFDEQLVVAGGQSEAVFADLLRKLAAAPDPANA